MVKKDNKKWKFLPLVLCILVVILSVSCRKCSIPLGRSYDYNNLLITYVADGDTVKVEGGRWIRLIGIDCPEFHESDKLFRQAREKRLDIETLKKFGKLARDFTKKLLDNKKVRLEFDAEKQDKYGRLLAYVFLPDGTFVNAEILKQGYAQILSIPPNVKYAENFLAIQKEAQSAQRGLWRMSY
ncbi:MAG: thermonuclease [Candidatus Omnitrophica bacterium CG11_big_fil_rev_8_21_14_0_20_42_13]|uniref:Thermonuclease n=1 Tax=Candidatus Ghiorseimicrobium undicola TaxID=1974746 RepID=A0A2H0LYU5_9BACT|nr:MAG: thermonuclease [Candidatus Omnitrophica bacterium CG11_big_fil_rev_8_21_14_0_20_42_13]